ncbi:MAG: hypothetical protein JXB62_07155 [Pirellulales bacterium]|nr:hypothetical protein [Pirellulales bacterium]
MSRITGVLSSGHVVDEERPGWSMQSPICETAFRYTILNIRGGFEPFLYSDATSDFVLRNEDAEAIALMLRQEGMPTTALLRGVYQQLEAILESCPNGGKFSRWTNFKCPRCNYEFPYNRNIAFEETRYYEPKIIWIEGATAYRGETAPSNRLARVVLQPRR